MIEVAGPNRGKQVAGIFYFLFCSSVQRIRIRKKEVCTLYSICKRKKIFIRKIFWVLKCQSLQYCWELVVSED